MAKRAKTPTPPKGKRATKQQTTPTSAWWEQAEEVPRAGLPDVEVLNKRSKRLRRVVWSTIFLAPLSMFVTILAFGQMLGADAEDDTRASADAYSDTKAKAMVAVRDWLASTPAPLPGGQLVSWHSATDETEEDTDSSGSSTTYVVETHRLTVSDPVDNIYDAYVSLGVVDGLAPVVIDTPNLIPRLPSAEQWDGPVWPGLDETSSTDELRAAVTAWSQAYSSGDSAALRLAIGDDDSSRHYVPLPGATLTQPSVAAVASLWSDDVEPARRDGLADTVVVRATFQIVWPGLDADGKEITEGAPATYDLLVRKANTAAPVVVAWGGAGSGPSLKPYGNAVNSAVVLAPIEASQTPDSSEDDQ